MLSPEAPKSSSLTSFNVRLVFVRHSAARNWCYMATLQLRLKYQTLTARLLFWLSALTSPVWFFLPLIALIFNFCMSRGFYDNLASPLIPELIALSKLSDLVLLFPLLSVGGFGLLIFRKQPLVITQQGMLFPMFSYLDLRGKRNRSWYELEEVSIDSAGFQIASYDELRAKKIIFKFTGAAPLAIPLKDFSPTEVEQIILAIGSFADSARGKESLKNLRTVLQTEVRLEGQKSYTNLWEDELRYRYSTTTFIPLSPGSTLQDGEIEVIRQLGFGGLSAIYLVQHQNKNLAILKESVLPADVDAKLKDKAEEQFRREAMILAELKHKQIARVLDFFVEKGHYLLLEYVQGQDLRRYLGEHGKLPEKKALLFALQIASILRYLHERETPIIHRDLSPENLIVDEKSKIVLIDFGAANEFLHTATGTLVGKHAYMAPEQLKGKACTQSDLYSLGATLYFMLTGDDPLSLTESHPANSVDGISSQCDLLVADLCRLSKDLRIQSAADLEHRLKQMLGIGLGIAQ